MLELRGNWDHKLAHSNCWDIDILADLTEVISIIVQQGRNIDAILIPNPVQRLRQTIYMGHFNREQYDTQRPMQNASFDTPLERGNGILTYDVKGAWG